jgi:S-adenosylmethionine hydrolase
MAERKNTSRTNLIALLTDFSWHNWYLGVMKGVIKGINPDVRVIDLCHDVSSQDVREGSFILANSFAYFPRGTIFLCVVDPGVGSKRKNLIVQTEDHYFVAPDNGILSSIFEKAKVKKVFSVEPGEYTLAIKGSTFFGRDVFAPVAAHLSLGVKPGDMGSELSSVLIIPAQKPFVNKMGVISGRALYVDTFGNIITNVEEEYIESAYQGRVSWDDVEVRLAGRTIKGIGRYYAQGEEGMLIALINSWGYLEIAVNKGSAWRELGLKEKKSLEIFLFSEAAPIKQED